jgi:hypothetical protein
MREFVKSGCVKQNALWNFQDIGYLAAYAAHAVLAGRADGSHVVSVRAPQARPEGAHELCGRFSTGGGRRGAGGIDRLPQADFERFIAAFAERYERE